MPSDADALDEARRMHELASSRGFDWPDASGVIAKVKEEVRELEDAMAQGDLMHAQQELGDLLFTAVNLSRFLGANPAHVLRATTERFRTRFERVDAAIAAQGRRMEDCTLAELDLVWEQVKKTLPNNAKTS